MTPTIGLWTPMVLSTTEFEVCWDYLELGRLPLILDLPSAGRTHAERKSIADGVLAGVTDRGLLDDLASTLRPLNSFSWGVDAHLVLDRTTRVRAAVSGQTGVFARIDGAAVILYAVPDHAVISELLAYLPDAAVPRAPSVSLRTEALDQALRHGDDVVTLVRELTALGERASDAREFARMVENSSFHGQFGTAREHGGTVVAWHDTPRGRFMTLRRNDWTTCTPADPVRLRTAIEGLVAEAERG